MNEQAAERTTATPMHHQHHSVSMHYARTIIASARRKGLDVEKLLDAAGLDEYVAQKPQLRMTAEQFSELLLQFWQQADDEFLGMAGGQSLHGTFTMMAKQAVQQPDLRGVYTHISRFYHLVNQGLHMRLDEEEKEAAFILDREKPELDPDNTMLEFFMLLHHRFPGWLIGKRIPLLRVEVRHAKPQHAAEYGLIFPCDVIFDCSRNALVMDSANLEAPVIQTPEALRKHLKDAPLNWVTRQTYSPKYTRKTLDYLDQMDLIGNARIDELADTLHITSRTLRRRLIEEKSSFQELKDRVRRDKAIHLLSHQGETVSEISKILGFSDTATFSRAFKHWTGISPSEYRRG